MADRIKGITVEIGGDTQGLNDALKDVNNTSRDLQKELRDVQRLLKFDPNNAELLAQRQKLLNEQIENTSKKLGTLKEAEAQVQAQFERGDIGADQYRAFQRELQDTQQFLRHTENALADLNSEQNNIQSSTRQLEQLFEATGTSIEDFADAIGDRTVRAIQQGTASSRDLEQAFERVAREAVGAEADLDDIRRTLGQLDNGEANIRQVNRALDRMSDEAREAREDLKGIGSELGGMAAGIGAGIGLAGIVEQALDVSALDTQIDLSFNVPEESKGAVKDVIKTIEAYGIDGEAALAGVRTQWNLNADASDEANAAIVKGAAAVVKSYEEIDFSELMQETNELAEVLGISQEDAIGMTNALLDMGFPAGEIDIIAEYGSQMKMAGYSAEQVQAIFAAGIDTKSWNIDVLLDGVKEGRILIAEMGVGVDDATAKMIEGTTLSAEKLQAWGAAVAEGGEAGSKAMNEVALELSGIEDASKRNEIGTRLFGTLWEEQGQKITDTLINANEETVNFAENTQVVTDKVNAIDSSAPVAMKEALNDVNEALEPLMLAIAGFVSKVAEWVQQNPELTAAIAVVVVGIGLLVAAGMALAPVLTTLTAAAGFFQIALLPLIGIILGVIAVIALIVAAIIYWKRHSDEIIAKIKELAQIAKTKFEEFKASVVEKIEETKEDIKTIWGKVMAFFEDIDLIQTGKDIIQGLIDGIWEMAEKVWTAAKDIASGIAEKIGNILDLGSPSKVMIAMGKDTGKGMEIGLEKSMSNISKMAEKMGRAAIPDMPKTPARNSGELAAAAGNTMTVNIHSPKALNTREANVVWGRTMKKLALQW